MRLSRAMAEGCALQSFPCQVDRFAVAKAAVGEISICRDKALIALGGDQQTLDLSDDTSDTSFISKHLVLIQMPSITSSVSHVASTQSTFQAWHRDLFSPMPWNWLDPE